MYSCYIFQQNMSDRLAGYLPNQEFKFCEMKLFKIIAIIDTIMHCKNGLNDRHYFILHTGLCIIDRDMHNGHDYALEKQLCIMVTDMAIYILYMATYAGYNYLYSYKDIIYE